MQPPTDLNFERQEVINWLIAHNYPALPVAPAQSAYEHYKIVQSKPEQGIWQHCPLTADLQPIALYTGKNPSYLDAKGVPHLVNHRSCQTRLPADQELKTWFANPTNGVGTLGGWNNTVWLDFDLKQFATEEDCTQAALKVFDKVKETFLERSHSGGWRIGVRVKQKPDFTNFALEPGGKHIGEALGEGRFTVLAPTIGPSGNSYKSINRAVPVEVMSLESIDIYTSTKSQRQASVTPQPADSYIPGSIPLEQLGNDTSREILQGSCPTGDRSEALATAAQEWYGWQNWTHNNGIHIIGDAATLAHHAGSLLGLDSDRINRILLTIDPTACLPAALYRGGEPSCWQKIYRLDKATFERQCPAHIKDGIKAEWQRRNNTRVDFGGNGGDGGDGGDGGSSGKVVKHSAFAPLTIEQVTEKIDELIAQGVSGSYLTGQLNRLAAASQYYVGELRKLYYERLGEADLECDRDSNRTEIENLLNLNDQSLNLHDYLPEDLANPLSLWCEWLSMRPEVVLTALLAGTSSLHKVGTELVIHRNQNFRVPPTIFAALVSESGQKKSPIFSNIIYQPLGLLRKEKVDAYNAAMADYEAAIQAWEQSENKGEKPQKPKEPTLYYFTNATGEAIPVQATKAPEKALLALIDELAGLLRSENSYRNGRGSDRQDFLSYFDGTGQTGLRASGIKTDVERIYLTIYGTIQPAVLKGHMADCSDPDGQWARFLFVNQPTVAATLSDDDGQAVQIRDRIADFYRQIDRLPEMEYYLSRDAFKRYQPVYNQLERLRVTHPNPGMRAVYSKMEGYIGRLAINLHVLWEIASGKACPSEEIPLFILEMAIQLAKFFIGQVRLIHAHSDNDELAPQIIKLIELSKRLDCNGANGWIKAKQYQETFPKKQRPSAQQARDWMSEAVTLGYGCTRGSGNRLEYHWNCDNNNPNNNPPPPDNLGNLGNTWGTLGETLPQPETLENKGVEDNLGNLGNVTPPFQTSGEINLSPSTKHKVGESKISLEGGYVPQPSPTLPQEPQTVEESSILDLGNNLGNPSPTLPQVPQVCDSPAVACVTVEPLVEQSAICASQQRFAIAQPESKPEVVEEQPEANQENQASLPIYQRSDGGFEISRKLRKLHYIGMRFTPRFTDSEGNEILVTPEMVLEETRRSVKPEYAYVKPEGVDCNDQGIRLENLKEIS